MRHRGYLPRITFQTFGFQSFEFVSDFVLRIWTYPKYSNSSAKSNSG
jgi:hypothetical protein